MEAIDFLSGVKRTKTI